MSPQAAPPRRTWVEHVMGTVASVTVRAAPSPVTGVDGAVLDGAVAAGFRELRRVDALFSLWRGDSELSRLARGELAISDCDPDIAFVLDLCHRARRSTEGWFDAGLPHDTGGRLPLDPGALVKGWAVERAADGVVDALAESGMALAADICVNAGGDLAVRCAGRSAVPWLVGVSDPGDPRHVVGALELRHGGAATSGSAARGAHVLDPRTGRPVDRGGAVTVHGPSLTWADAWATAAYARGGDIATWLAARLPAGYGAAVVDAGGAVMAVDAEGGAAVVDAGGGAAAMEAEGGAVVVEAGGGAAVVDRITPSAAHGAGPPMV